MYTWWWSIIGFGLKYWKYIVSSVAALAVGFGAAWYIQGIRVEYAKSEIEDLKSQIERCQAANETNQETIGNLKIEIESAQSLCKSRLGVKDKIITKLREIDALKGKHPKAAPDTVALTDSGRSGSKNVEGHPESALYNKEVEDEKGISDVGDPILHELNRMFSKADSKD